MDWVRGNLRENPMNLMDSKPMAWLTTRPKRKTAKVRQMAVAFNTSKGTAWLRQGSPIGSFGKSAIGISHGISPSPRTLWMFICMSLSLSLYIYSIYLAYFSIISLYIVHQDPSRPQLICKGKSTGRPGLKTSFLGVVLYFFPPEKNPGPSDYHRRYRIESQVLKNRNVL